MQTMLNAMRRRTLGAELCGQPVDSARIYGFAVLGLTGVRDCSREYAADRGVPFDQVKRDRK